MDNSFYDEYALTLIHASFNVKKANAGPTAIIVTDSAGNVIHTHQVKDMDQACDIINKLYIDNARFENVGVNYRRTTGEFRYTGSDSKRWTKSMYSKKPPTLRDYKRAGFVQVDLKSPWD